VRQRKELRLKKAIERGMSDSSLMALWRRAVLRHGGYRCAICGGGGKLECHHATHRRYRLLRFDWRNGVPVHAGECHETANRMGIYAAEGEYQRYIEDRAKLTYKQYLADTGLSDNEFRAQVKAELLREINA
jgi:hypothetical protein